MPKELFDKLTPVSQESLIYGFWSAWIGLFGEVPKKESIWLIVAHAKLECGLKYVHNYNLGNIKSRDGDGYDYQFFTCGEELPLATAQKAVKDDARVTIVRTYGSMASVRITPKHPWCRFRAFETLEDGMSDHLHMIHGRFKAAWPAVIAGDPAAYSHALRVQHYYTADEAKYTATLMRCFTDASKTKVDYDSLPGLPAEEVDKEPLALESDETPG